MLSLKQVDRTKLQLSALTKKGLRHPRRVSPARPGLQLSALTKKGLRREMTETGGGDIPSALCPDEEGIKTGASSFFFFFAPFSSLP